VLIIACAVVSWRFIERPFRSKKISNRTIRYAAAAAAVTLLTVATMLIWSDGLPKRLTAEAAILNEAVGTNYRCPVSAYIAFGASRACGMNLPTRNPEDADVVLLGNSHAQMYAPLWESILAGRGLTGLLVPLNACLPTVKVNISRGCQAAARQNLDAVSHLHRADTVIIGLTWGPEASALVDASGHVVNNYENAALVAGLDDLLDQLKRAGKRVVLIGPIAEPGWDVASVLSRELAFGHPVDHALFMPVSDFTRRFESAIEHFQARVDIGFARPDKVQCNAERCNYLIDGRSLFSDGSHIAAGELYRFRTMFQDALRSTKELRPNN
jgi:hypothetical protein